MSPAPTLIRRPFHWGVVILVDAEWTGEGLLEPDPERLVTANEQGAMVLVRHAQDTDEVEGEYLKFAEVDVHVRRLDAARDGEAGRREVYRGTIDLPSGTLNVGDADDEALVPAHEGANILVVRVEDTLPADDLAPDAVWVDLLPKGA